MRETINDNKTLLQINEVFKPLEYTRVDGLVELLFLTSEDSKGTDLPKEIVGDTENNTGVLTDKEPPMNFHSLCMGKIGGMLNKTFVKLSKTAYESSDRYIGISLNVSKTYLSGNNISFWFSFHPYQQDFLKEYKIGYAAFGCGNDDTLIIFPRDVFLEYKDRMTTTVKGNKMYWHVWIYKTKGHFELGQAKKEGLTRVNIDRYLNSIT